MVTRPARFLIGQKYFNQSNCWIHGKCNPNIFNMANARAVEEVPKSGKTRTKTSIFWSTVPEKEQFRNVQVPGVALDRFKDAKNNTQAQKYVQVVQKSKSDSAISNTRSDPLTVNKQGKTGHKFAVKQNDLSGKRKDASSIFKGI